MSDSVFIKVDSRVYSHVTRERRGDDQWDADDLAHDLTIRGLRVVQERESWDFVVKPPAQETYWLVWYRYSTGDSFHHETGCHAFVHLCKTREDAEFLVKFIEDAGRVKTHSFHDLEVYLPSGDEARVDPRWNGYFESLESADWDAFDLKGR
jgi:hypothetical protein